ncbi:4Fe-4S ferredoxin, partial [Collinsella aerofaciens]|nr:4Fe-4S ferredoxin [Collinsella aerofaciens]
SKVYYTNMKATFQENLPQKLKRLIKTAGIGEIDFENKYTAIKMHFGEPGNLAFLRPNYAAVVVNTVKELGG